MSVKSFISAEAHLAKLGFTVQQAQDFIKLNIAQPGSIYNAALNNGVTINMLNEISDYSTDIIREYFETAGLNSKELDNTSLLVNSDLGTLEQLVDFNEKTGILSNSELRKVVLPQVDHYDDTFKEIYPFQLNDGIYDAEELGVGNLTDTVSATKESLESLFYGSLVNMFSRLDENELKDIKDFTNSGNGNPEEFKVLLFNALNEPPSAIIRSDEELFPLVSEKAVEIIKKYWDETDDIELVGTLDYSFLGLAVA